MRMFLICIALIAFNYSCSTSSRNSKNILIHGCIKDYTGKPIPFAKVTVLSWYDAGWDKTDYVTVDTIADNVGCFQVSFDEGYKIIIAATAENYPPKLKVYNEFKNGVINSQINLNAGKNGYNNLSEPGFTLRHFIVNNTDN